MVPEIARVGEEIGCLLAISFHATTDEVRDTLVPINRKWNIAALLDACRAYPRLSNAERITFEYVMLKGVNDSDADARRLVKLIAGIPAKINLIPFNPWPGAPYERSDPDRIEAFGVDRQPRRLRLAGQDPARRGHHGGLRPAQVRLRADPPPARGGLRVIGGNRLPESARLGVYQSYQAEMATSSRTRRQAKNEQAK